MILHVVGPKTITILAKEFAGNVLLAGEPYPTLGEVGWEVDMARAHNLWCCHAPLPLFGVASLCFTAAN